MIVSPRMITAPSCSGEYGVKIVASRSADTLACISDPDCTYSSSDTSRSIAMIAPIPDRLSRSTASAISSRDLASRAMCVKQPRHRRLADLRQRRAQLGREHDEQRDRAVAEHERQQIHDHREMQQIGDAVRDRQHDDARPATCIARVRWKSSSTR